jgi:hypothetical protein
MRRDQEDEVVVKDHLEEEAEVEGVSSLTSLLLNVTNAISSDTFNMSVLAGTKKLIMLSLMRKYKCC